MKNAWQVVKAIVYLALVMVLLFASGSKFETRVIAILVLVYGAVAAYGMSITTLVGNLHLAVTKTDNEAQTLEGKFVLGINAVAFGIGDIIAIGALVLSLF